MAASRALKWALLLWTVAAPLAPWPVAAQEPIPRRARVPKDTARLERRAAVPGAGARADTALGADTAAVLFPEVDSVMQALLARPGYVPVRYRAEKAVRFDSKRRAIELWGNARMERLGDRLDADSVVYVDTAALVTAYPPVTLTNAEGQVVNADSVLVYHTETRRSTVLGARTTWGEWFVSGDATLEGRDTLWVRHGTFTSCDLEVPHYHFAADKMKLILGKIVVAWPVRLYFGDVPVFWFPFFAQDIRRGRHSGILPPRFGVNDVVRQSRGHRRSVENVGYYWAINNYTDAQVNLDWLSGIYTKLDGFFRYNWRRQFLSGNLGYSHTFRRPQGQVLSLTWNHQHRLSERSDFRTAVRFTSNADFVRSTTRDPVEAIQEFRSDAVFNRRFDWGTVVVGGQRVQGTTRSIVTWNAPNVSVTLTPLTFLRGLGRGLTWSGSAAFRQQIVTQDSFPDRRTLTASTSSGLTFGALQLSSGTSYTEEIEEAPDLLIRVDTVSVGGDTAVTFPDTVVLGPSQVNGLGNWSVSLGYRQRLIGSTTFTPGLAVSGNFFRSRETGLAFVSVPARVATQARLTTDLFGFFPGVGPVRRIRHKVSPSFNWVYRPEVTVSQDLQRLRGFPVAEAREQHQLSVSLSQTFEGKLRARARSDTTPGEAAGRSAAPADRKLTLLAIRTSAIVYDFVRAREPGQSGIVTDRLSNTITSDLLRVLQIQTEHDLFAEQPDGGRDFDPFLAVLNLSFSLGGGAQAPPPLPGGGLRSGTQIVPDFADRPTGAREAVESRTGGGEAGPWNVSLNYALLRTRPAPDAPSLADRQTLNLSLSFRPTANWRAHWTTTYDFEERKFLQQFVSLQRDLHHWLAQFRFTRTVTGNFAFDFTVSLIPAPDIKFDYRQQSLPAASR